MYTDQSVSLIFFFIIQTTINTKTGFFYHQPLPNRSIFYMNVKSNSAHNYMKHCYQRILLQNNLSSQRRLTQRGRVVKQNQL